MTTLQTPLALATTVTTSGALAAGKHTPCDATSGALTMTLPTPANVGARLRVEKVDTTANTVTVSGQIRGVTSSIPMYSQYESREFFAETLTSWRPSADHRTTASQDARYDPAGAAATAQGNSLQKSANLSDVASASTARTNLGLGTAATQASSAFDAAGAATAAQAFAVQRGNHTGTQAAGTITGLATVATSGAYTDLSGLPTLGTAAAQPTSAFDAAGAAAAVLPTQTGNSGKVLGTNGAAASWVTMVSGGVPTVINVKDAAYGAVGDGTTDDTAAIQAALTAVPSGGGIVHFPAGTYKVTAALTCSNPVIVQGIGYGSFTAGGSRIVYTPTTGVCLTLAADGSQVRDIAFTHAIASRSTAGAGVKFTGGNFCRVNRVLISGFWNNLEWSAGGYYNITDSVIVDAANYCVQLAYDASPDHGDQTISGCYIGKYTDTVSGGTAVHWQSGGGLRFVNNKINAGSQQGYGSTARLTTGLHIDVGSSVQTSVFIITGNSIENCTSRCIYFTDAGAGSFINKVVIVGNEIASFGGTGSTCIEFAQSSVIDGLNIGNNQLSDADNGIILKRVTSATIMGNSSHALAVYGIHLTTGVKQTTVRDNRWNQTCTNPYFADNTDQTNDNSFEASFLVNITTASGTVDVFTFTLNSFGAVYLEVEIAGIAQGSGAVGSRMQRWVSGNGASADLIQATIGTDSTLGTAMTAAVATSTRAGVGAVTVAESAGTGLQATVRVRVSGGALKGVKQLVQG